VKPKEILNADDAAESAGVVEFSEAEYAQEFRRAQAFFPRGPLLSESLKLLSQQLHAAFTEETASERQRYIRAINAVGYFLIDFNGGDGYARKFAELQWALEDLDKGTVAPFLKRKFGQGSRYDPEEIWQARAVVAVGIEALLQRGDSMEEILQYIGRHHRGLHNLMTRESDKTDVTSDKSNPLEPHAISFESSVQGWHRKFVTGRGKAPPERSCLIFAHLKKELDERRRNRDSASDVKHKFLRDTADQAFAQAAEIATAFKQRRELEESKKYAEE
jgi:hypothetical protein